MILTTIVRHPAWQSWGLLVARLIIAAVFAIAVSFKYMNIGGTASYIAAAGLPASLLLAWLATIFETLVIVAFLTGFHMREAAMLAIVYVLFLGFMFHGPQHWAASQDEFGFFVDHFTFAAALIALVAAGPGTLALGKR